MKKIGMFNNDVWVIKKLRVFIPEDPFEVLINGESMGKTKLLAFAKRVPNTDRFPQVLVIYSSGYLRLKAGADPTKSGSAIAVFYSTPTFVYLPARKQNSFIYP